MKKLHRDNDHAFLAALQARLDEAGITNRAVTDTGPAELYMGSASTSVFIADDADFQRAQAIVEEVRGQLRRKVCPACGYDLRGSAGPCPECGALGSAAPVEDRPCAACGEVVPSTFEVCWNCGAAQPEG